VSHILVGTYEMRPFRKINPQLALRSIDVHFPRYDMNEEQDCLMFQSALWALQRQLPVEEEPLLAQKHWEFLYARSIGCVGLGKRVEGRDPTGQEPDNETMSNEINEEQAAG
jgi:hypothetical protein